MPLRMFAFASTFVPSTLTVPTRAASLLRQQQNLQERLETASKFSRRNLQIVS